jgi:hypothetical protein
VHQSSLLSSPTSQRGASMVEYALALALIILVLALSLQQLQEAGEETSEKSQGLFDGQTSMGPCSGSPTAKLSGEECY